MDFVEKAYPTSKAINLWIPTTMTSKINSLLNAISRKAHDPCLTIYAAWSTVHPSGVSDETPNSDGDGNQGDSPPA
jgi:hypothetical protein